MHPYLAPGYFWLALLIATAIFEVIQLRRHKPTLSQWVWNFSKKYTWLRWLTLGALAFLAYHFFSKG